MTKTDYIDAIQRKCKDAEGRLSDQDWEDALTEALTDYTRHRPQRGVSLLTGEGTAFLPTPAGWEPDSDLLKLEAIGSDGRPTAIRLKRVQIDVNPGEPPRVMLTDSVFVSGTTYRVTFSMAHTITDASSSVPSGDAGGVVSLAASLACTRLAAAYAQNIDSQMGAITIDNPAKVQEYRGLSKDYREEFERVVGGAASASVQGKLKTWRRESPLLLHA